MTDLTLFLFCFFNLFSLFSLIFLWLRTVTSTLQDLDFDGSL